MRNIVSAPVDVGELKKRLFQSGKSLGELAECAEVSRYTLFRIMNGESVRPATLKKIADALSVDPLDLIAAAN